MPTLTKTQTPLTTRYLFEVRRFLMLAIGLFAVSFLAIFVGMWPQIQTSLELYSDLQATQQKVATLEQKNRQLADVLDPSLSGQIDTVEALLPSRKPLIELLTSMNVLGQQNQIVFEAVELTPGIIATDSATTALLSKGNTDGSGSESLKVTMSIKGTLGQINQFFTEIERTTPLTTVTSLGLTPQSDQVLAATDTVEILNAQPYKADVTITASYFVQSVSARVDANLPVLTTNQTQLLSRLQSFTLNRVDPQTQVVGGGLEDLFKVVEPVLIPNSVTGELTTP